MVDTYQKNNIAVSVIVPVYNVEQYLSQCLDTIVQQTLRNIEIICIDDGSTDQSYAILQSYAKNDDRFHLVQQQNMGAGVARNKGLEIARGKYLSFLDADDFYELEMLEKAYIKCEHDQADICIFDSKQFDQRTQQYARMPWTIKRKYLPETLPFFSKQHPEYIFQMFNGWAWDKLYRSAFVKEMQLYFQELRTTNDAYFVFMANVLAGKITIIDEVLAYHRVNASASLSVTREQSWDCCWQAVNKIKTELINRQKYEYVERSFINWAVHFLLWNVHTLQGTARDNLMDAIHNQYADSLHIQQYDSRYFYDRYEYHCFLKIQLMGKNANIKDKFLHKIVRNIRENGIRITLQKICEKV